MNYRAVASVAIAAAIAFSRPIAFIAQETGRAGEILAAARKAIGGQTLDSLKTFSVQSTVQRTAGQMQIQSDVEVLLDLPEKYARTETLNGGGGAMVMRGGGTSGFNGDTPLQKMDGRGPTGGAGMIVRIGPGGTSSTPMNEKPTPAQLEQQKRLMLRGSRAEASRLMLGWFAMAHPASKVSYTYLGEAESADGKAYVISAKNDDGFETRLFVDEDTHLPLMVTYKGPLPRIVRQTTELSPEDVQKQLKEMQEQPPEIGEFTIYFEDWRNVDGVRFPFKMRRATGGKTSEEWSVTKVTVNPKIDPKKFDPA
jgi:hypothetical protein